MRSRRLARRVGWGIADQALSSLTNFALGVLVARSVGARGFGAFSLAFATYLLAMGVGRAIACEPLVIRFPDSDRVAWEREARAAAGASLAIGAVIGAVVAIGGVLLGGSAGSALLHVSPFLPSLLLQDCWRFIFFAQRDGKKAFVNDLVWAGAQVVGVTTVLVLDLESAGALIVAWAGGASLAAVFGAFQTGLRPSVQSARSWMRSHKDLWPRFLGEFAARSGVNSGALYITSMIAGLVEGGALRAGQVLLGPVNIINQGVTMVSMAESTRLIRRPEREVLRALVAISLAIAVPALLWGGALTALPDRWGRELLGATWSEASDVLVPLSVSLAALGVQTGPLIGLRAMQDAERSFRLRLWTGVLVLCGVAVGAWAGGSEGAAIGISGALVVASFGWWRGLFQALELRGGGGLTMESERVSDS